MSPNVERTADRIEQQAAVWLVQRERPDWTPGDQAALEAWLEAATAHKLAFWRLEHGWTKADRLAALRGTARPDAPAASRTRRPRRRWRMATAASLAMAAVLAAAHFGGWLSAGHARYETPVGGHQTLPLADGSRIELNTDTRVRAAVTASARQVWLDRGEAYFEVRHDARRPFVVWAGERRITVLGTRFSVRRDGDRVKVAVAEGRVEIAPAAAGAPVRAEVVAQGGIAVAQGASTLVTPASPERVSGALSWRRGMLTFDEATLADAAAEFNRYNTTRLVLGDEEAAGVRIGGTFEAGNVDAFARLLGSAYGLRVTERDGAIEISR